MFAALTAGELWRLYVRLSGARRRAEKWVVQEDMRQLCEDVMDEVRARKSAQKRNAA